MMTNPKPPGMTAEEALAEILNLSPMAKHHLMVKRFKILEIINTQRQAATAELEAENQRLREALEVVLGYLNWPTGVGHTELTRAKQIATEALKQEAKW